MLLIFVLLRRALLCVPWVWMADIRTVCARISRSSVPLRRRAPPRIRRFHRKHDLRTPAAHALRACLFYAPLPPLPRHAPRTRTHCARLSRSGLTSLGLWDVRAHGYRSSGLRLPKKARLLRFRYLRHRASSPPSRLRFAGRGIAAACAPPPPRRVASTWITLRACRHLPTLSSSHTLAIFCVTVCRADVPVVDAVQTPRVLQWFSGMRLFIAKSGWVLRLRIAGAALPAAQFSSCGARRRRCDLFAAACCDSRASDNVAVVVLWLCCGWRSVKFSTVSHSSLSHLRTAWVSLLVAVFWSCHYDNSRMVVCIALR